MRLQLLLLPWIMLPGIVGAAGLPPAATEFCALTVKVSDWTGRPINSTQIQLINSAGDVELRRVVGSEFEICDFTFGPHTLRVGPNECFPLSVSNLEVKLGHPILLDLRMPQCAYGRPLYGSLTGERACFGYFRTTMPNGTPLAKVEISPKIGSGPWHTDSYGRWQGVMAGTREITFRKPGFEPNTLRVGCPDTGPVEISVPLKPRL